MKLLILGGDSIIGRNLYSYCIHNHIDVRKTTRKMENVDQNTYFYCLGQPLNTDGYSSVIICAENGNLELIKQTIKSIKCHIIYISSSTVFNCSQLCTMLDEPLPNTKLGKYKLSVEKLLDLKKDCIFRIPKLMCTDTPIIKTWQNQLFNGGIKAFDNRFISPIDIDTVLRYVKLIIRRRYLGVLHACGEVRMSYYEYACTLYNSDKVQRVSADESIEEYNPCLF